MPKILKIGLIGCGRIATYAHLPCYKKLKNVNVVAVADSLKDRAEATARKFGIKNWYTDHRDLLKSDKIDAIDICSPPYLHAEHCVTAAENGIHVLCEKPVAIKVKDAQAIASTVEKAKIKFMVGNAYRFHPLYCKIKEEIENPEVMWITNVFRPLIDWRARAHWIYDPKKSGGILVEQAVHWFDLFRWLGGEIGKVYALSRPSDPFENFAISVRFKNSAVGTLTQSSNSSLPIHTFGVINSEKTATINGSLLPSPWGGVLQIQDKKKHKSAYMLIGRKCQRIPTRAMGFLSQAFSRVQDSSLVPFCNEIEYFVNCIREDKTPEVTITDGLKCLEIAEAAYTSARLEKEIVLSSMNEQLSYKLVR